MSNVAVGLALAAGLYVALRIIWKELDIDRKV